MAAIYKRHLGVDPRKNHFPFGEDSFQGDKEGSFLTGTQDKTPTIVPNFENASPKQQCEEAEKDRNIFRRITKFTAGLHRNEASDELFPNMDINKSPTWECSLFSSFDDDSDSSQETITSSIAYVVETVVFDCVIINVNVTTKDISEFPVEELESVKESAGDLSEENPSPHPHCSHVVDVEINAEDLDQPISQRVRERHKRHKTGGLFPKNLDTLYDWLDDPFSSDQSEIDDVDIPSIHCRAIHESSKVEKDGAGKLRENNSTFDRFIVDKSASLSFQNTKDLKVVLNRQPTNDSALSSHQTIEQHGEETCKTSTVVEVALSHSPQVDEINHEISTHHGVKEHSKRNSSVLQQKLVSKSAHLDTAVAVATGEESLTDLRLAMEFPRHNWLVKHLMKEKMLKHEENVDSRKPPQTMVSPSSPTPENICRTPTPPKKAMTYDKAIGQVVAPRETKVASKNGGIEDGDCDVTEAIVTSAPVATSSISEGTYMIGIVKPFHYHESPKPKSPPVATKEKTVDEPSPKRRKTQETSPEVAADAPVKKSTAEVSQPVRAPVDSICNVKIEKYFSLADADHVPLDLSNKEKPAVDEFVLDLSGANTLKGAKVEQTNPDNSRDVKKTDQSLIPTSQTTTTHSITTSTDKGPSNTPNKEENLGNIELYELVRKRTQDEQEKSAKKKQENIPKANGDHLEKTSSPKTTSASPAVKKNDTPKLKPQSVQSAVIDVDALDDNLPNLTPRHRTPRNDVKVPPKPVPIPVPRTTLNSHPRVPHIKHNVRAQRSVSPGATSSLAALNNLMTSNRTRSVDESPSLRFNRFLDNKPHSAPPNVTPIIRMPNQRIAMPLTAPPSRAASVELHRPNNGQIPVTGQKATMNQPKMQPFVNVHRRHGLLPSEHSLLSPKSMTMGAVVAASSHQPFVVASKPNEEQFRVPVKPTPIHYKRIQPYPQMQPQHQQQGFPRPSVGKGLPPPPAMAQQRPLMSRSNVVRAPPGGVAINSTPIRSSHIHSMPGAQHPPNLSSNAPFFKMTPEAAQKFSAHLKVQQKELEDKINSLKELERKIQPATSYHHPLHQITPPHRHITYQKNLMHHPQQDLAQMRAMVPTPYQHNGPLQHSNGYPSTVASMGLEKLRSVNSSCHLSSPPNFAAEEKCAVCMKRAYFVCSGCRSLWYCSKTCQFQDWSKHCNSCH